MPPTPMPRLMSAKLTPKYFCRRSPLTTVAISALNAGQETPKLMPIRTRAKAATPGEVANASTTLPTIIAVSPPSRTARAP